MNEHKYEQVEVWGINIPTTPSGRRKWPKAIKVKAVEQVAAGRKIKDIANEIGANQSLVSKWLSGTAANSPTFVEIISSVPTQDTARSTYPLMPHESCQIQIGDTDVTIPIDYPVSHLIEVLRAVRISQ